MINEFKRNLREARAERQGVALSRARRIKPFAEIGKAIVEGRPTPTTTTLRMFDGAPMVYFSDGSLRHVTGYKAGKAARKVRKRANRYHQKGR